MRYSGDTKLYRTADGRIVGADDPDRGVLVAVPGLAVNPGDENAVREYLSDQNAANADEPTGDEAAPKQRQPSEVKRRQPAEDK